MSAGKNSLGAILLRYNLISEEDLQAALEEQQRTGARLGETLVRMGSLKEDVLTWCLATQLNIPCVSAIDTRPDRLDLEALNTIPAALAHRHHVVPLLMTGHDLTIVTDDPLDREALDEIERVTGLHLNVAAGPTSEVLRALEELYGPDPSQSTSEAPEFDFGMDDGASGLDMLDAWLTRTRNSGHLKFTLEAHADGGRLRVRGRGRALPSQGIERETFQSLMAAFQEACGIGRPSEPTLLPFSVGSHQGTVAFAEGADGPMVAVSLEDTLERLDLPTSWGASLRSQLRGPGLWLLGIHSRRLWRPFVQGMVTALGPERRVVAAGEGGAFVPVVDRYEFTASTLEGLLGLEPDLLILPAKARDALIEHLRGGLPDSAILLQVAAQSPLRALQVLRSAGLSGPEMAETVRGVLCISTLARRCPACRARSLELAAPLRLAAGAEGESALELEEMPMAGNVDPMVTVESMASLGAHLRLEDGMPGAQVCVECQDTGVAGEVPVLSWCELSPELEAGLSENEPISSLKAHLRAGPVPHPVDQVQAYLDQGLISARTAEAFMTT